MIGVQFKCLSEVDENYMGEILIKNEIVAAKKRGKYKILLKLK